MKISGLENMIIELIRQIRYAVDIKYANDIKHVLDVARETERLAEIGKSTEKAFQIDGMVFESGTMTFENVDDLITWARGGGLNEL